MTDAVVVIGGGIGGMVAALRARRHGASVTLVEAREALGGLASPVVCHDGPAEDRSTMRFDGGPYILLDRTRLSWALAKVGIDLSAIPMVELDPVFTFEGIDGRRTAVHADPDRTALGMNLLDPGSGDRYRRFVTRATAALDHLAPLLVEPHDPRRFVATGAWRAAPWVLGSLHQLLRLGQLAGPAASAVSIWTAIAGGDPRTAPGPSALVPALIHRDGAVRPAGGVHRLVDTLERRLHHEGVEVVSGAPVTTIVTDRRTRAVAAVRLATGEELAASVVIADVGGAAALLDLLDVDPPRSLRRRLDGPLQSPGLTAYVRLRGPRPAEVRFRVIGENSSARAIIHPTETDSEGWAAGRLIAPLGLDRARRLGEDGQRRLLDAYLAERWWRRTTAGNGSEVGELDVEVATTRIVDDWAGTFRLRDNAMNLAMARRAMLQGRLPHRVAATPGLFLTGSWTHPGQWVSFCAVSGVLAADAAEAAPHN